MHDAFEEAVLDGFSVSTSSTSYGSSSTPVAAPDGSFIALDGAGLGVNLFGHDCVAVGNVSFVNGTP